MIFDVRIISVIFSQYYLEQMKEVELAPSKIKTMNISYVFFRFWLWCCHQARERLCKQELSCVCRLILRFRPFCGWSASCKKICLCGTRKANGRNICACDHQTTRTHGASWNCDILSGWILNHEVRIRRCATRLCWYENNKTCWKRILLYMTFWSREKVFFHTEYSMPNLI